MNYKIVLYILVLLQIVIIGVLYPTEYFETNNIGSCYFCYLQYITNSQERNPFYCKGRHWRW